MLRRWVALGLVVLVAHAAQGCSFFSLGSDELLENRVSFSSNGRFLAVDRRHEGVPDFKARLARDVFPNLGAPDTGIYDGDTEIVDADGEILKTGTEPVEEQPATPRRLARTVALYEARPKAPRLLAEVAVDVDAWEVLVSDEGRIVAINRVTPSTSCSSASEPGDVLLHVYASDGRRIGVLRVEDVFSSGDVRRLTSYHGDNVAYTLRHESDTREVLVLAVNGTERRVDLATASLIDPKTNILPQPRVYAVAASEEMLPRPFETVSADCEEAFAARDTVRLDAEQFYRQAVSGPLPLYPSTMWKARISGWVLAEVVVSEQGRVECVRTTPLPFGGSKVVAEAVRNWRFDPVTVDGRRTRFAGRLLFRFEDLHDAAWQDYLRVAPPVE